jgi:hypothetical protein
MHLDVDPKTLRKYFRQELDRGTVDADVKVAQSLFQMATQGKNVAAAFFWMKARAGWREKQEVKISSEPVNQLFDADLYELMNVSQHTIKAEADEKDEHSG